MLRFFNYNNSGAYLAIHFGAAACTQSPDVWHGYFQQSEFQEQRLTETGRQFQDDVPETVNFEFDNDAQSDDAKASLMSRQAGS